MSQVILARGAVDGEWTGTISCGELQNSPNAKSKAPFTGAETLTIHKNSASLDRSWPTGKEHLEGMVSRGQPLKLEGQGWFYGKEANAWKVRVKLFETGQRYDGEGVIESVDGLTKYRDCKVRVESAIAPPQIPTTTTGKLATESTTKAPKLDLAIPTKNIEQKSPSKQSDLPPVVQPNPTVESIGNANIATNSSPNIAASKATQSVSSSPNVAVKMPPAAPSSELEAIAPARAIEEFTAFQDVDFNDATRNEMPSEIIFSHDGKRVAIGTSHGRVMLFELKSGRSLINLPISQPYRENITALAFSSDDSMIAYLVGGKVNLVDVSTGKITNSSGCLKDYEETGHCSSGGQSLAFSPDNKRLAIGGIESSRRGCNICVVQVPSLKIIWPTAAKGSDRIYSAPTYGDLIWTPDGKYFFGSSTLWNSENYKEIRDGNECVAAKSLSSKRVAMSRDGKVLFLLGERKVCSVSTVEGRTLQVREKSLGFPPNPKWIGISPNGEDAVLGQLGGNRVDTVTVPLSTLKPEPGKSLIYLKNSKEWITHFAVDQNVKNYAVIVRVEQPKVQNHMPLNDFVVRTGALNPR